MKRHFLNGIVLVLLIALGGCATDRPAARPSRTRFGSKLSIVPAQPIGDYLVLEAKWDKNGPYHFIVDTGSTVTLVSAELANRYPSRVVVSQNQVKVKVRSARGELVALPAAELREIELGDVVFENVPVVVFDFSTLSAHLGVKVDGILGFPLFRDTILTLDYPRKQILLAPTDGSALQPGSTIEFNNASKTPVIPIGLGDGSLFVLVDSGSDGALTLNPTAVRQAYEVAPREGPMVGTLTGQHAQSIGRLAGGVRLGNYELARPIVELTDDLSSIGAGVLKNFTVTFNQQRNRVTFFRDTPGPVTFPSRRTVGLSFAKESAYWRVVGVVPGTPAAAAAVQQGELVTRINGDPVADWNLNRLEETVASADSLLFTFINGNRETEKKIAVVDLVP